MCACFATCCLAKNAQRFFWIFNTLPCRGAGPHNRLLRRQHCSSLCLQSEGHEHVANIASALGHTFVGFLAVFGRHNIRPPHFASKVSYNASPQAFAACSRSASCSGAATAILFGQKLRREFSFILNTLPFRGNVRLSTNLDCLYFKHPPLFPISARNIPDDIERSFQKGVFYFSSLHFDVFQSKKHHFVSSFKRNV